MTAHHSPTLQYEPSSWAGKSALIPNEGLYPALQSYAQSGGSVGEKDAKGQVLSEHVRDLTRPFDIQRL